MNRRTFADFEREGWDRNAPAYADNVLPLTEQAFVPQLDSRRRRMAYFVSSVPQSSLLLHWHCCLAFERTIRPNL
jgi:hypothetical protein